MDTRARTSAPAEPEYVLTLYVFGSASPKSARAMVNIRALCESLVRGRYRLTVVDIARDAAAAARAQIVATPTLVRESPSPLRRLVGDLSLRDLVIEKLGLPRPREASAA
ncbi:MAG TPA: circadian clock KaiB family protein [Burkholderiales bacterium]|jgi:circadian clock protein KaiB|nr:circadian clock KaiB family protein [Burkholderiales bacterium]